MSTRAAAQNSSVSETHVRTSLPWGQGRLPALASGVWDGARCGAKAAAVCTAQGGEGPTAQQLPHVSAT